MLIYRILAIILCAALTLPIPGFGQYGYSYSYGRGLEGQPIISDGFSGSPTFLPSGPYTAEQWGSGTTYYVDPINGNDAAAGTSISTAWATLAKVEAFSSAPGFAAGDNIKLRRGGIFRERLQFYSSGTLANPIWIGSYGSGNKPTIYGSEQQVGKTWTDEGSNVWSTSMTTETLCISIIKVGGTEVPGVNDLTPAADYEWYWSTNKFYIYSVGNPNSYYSSIEAAQRDVAIRWTSAVQYVNVQDIIGKTVNQDIFTCQGGNIASVYRLQGYFAWAGLASNGFTAHAASNTKAYDCYWEYCQMAEGYNDTGCVSDTYDVTMYNCKNGFSTGGTNTSSITRAYIYTSPTVSGVLGIYGPVTMTASILTGSWSTAVVSNDTAGVSVIKNVTVTQVGNGKGIYAAIGSGAYTLQNVSIICTGTGVTWHGATGVTYTGNNNSFYKASGDLIIKSGVTYTTDQFANYKAAVSPQDTASINTDPQIVDPDGQAENLHILTSGSPCKEAGMATSVTSDAWQRPISGAYQSIGGHQYASLYYPDGLGDITGISGVPVAGPVPWTVVSGTVGISGGVYKIAANTSAVSVLGTGYKYVSAKLTRAAGSIGVIMRWTDINNYVRAIHNGTNIQLVQTVTGTPTTLISAVTAYSAGARIILKIDGQTATVWYNGSQVGTPQTIDAGLSSGKIGLYGFNANGSTMDDFMSYSQ